MQEICLFCFFILGLTAGSFLHAAAISIPDAFPIVRTWRCCGHCHSSLPVSALIPPLNWLIWRGKCPEQEVAATWPWYARMKPVFPKKLSD